jgi:uncharacterized protein (TIGR02597 family)
MSASPRFLLTSLAAGLLVSALPAAAQTATATTDPVGFITLAVSGNGGSGTALSFKALGLYRQVEYQGNAEQIINAQTLKDTDANWVDQQFNPTSTDAYYVEITGPTGASGIGTTYDIVSTDAAAQTITIAANQSFTTAGIQAGATFRVRKHWTIAAAFGAANEGGLTPGAPGTADIVRIYDAQGSFTGYYYSNSGTPGTGWRKTSDATAVDRGPTVIFPDDGLVIAKSNGTTANVVLMGSVKTGQTSSPVVSGLNVLANPYAAPMTLGSCGLFTDNATTGVASGSSSKADQVMIYNGTGYDTYYYSSGGAAGVGWRKAGAGAVDQSTVQIAVGASVIVKRNGSAFNWVAPQHPTTL